jgi:iron complex outermembrane recepter protein
LHDGPLSQDTVTVPSTEGSDPHLHARIRSHFQVFPSLAWEAFTYFTDRLVYQKVLSYTRLDSGLLWQWKEGLTFSLVGQDLLQDHHLEFIESTGISGSTLVKRSGYAKITWRF